MVVRRDIPPTRTNLANAERVQASARFCEILHFLMGTIGQKTDLREQKRVFKAQISDKDIIARDIVNEVELIGVLKAVLKLGRNSGSLCILLKTKGVSGERGSEERGGHDTSVWGHKIDLWSVVVDLLVLHGLVCLQNLVGIELVRGETRKHRPNHAVE